MRYMTASLFAPVCASLLLLILRLPLSTAFPNGAPEAACDTLSPNPFAHGANPTPCGPGCPFRIEVVGRVDNTYTCGEPSVLLRLFSVDETPFRGFFVQSRTLTNQFTPDTPFVGGFVNNDQFPLWQIRPCDGVDAGATHTDRSDKVDVFLVWRPPPPGEFAPPVRFWFSIVQQRILYHVQLEGPVLLPDVASCQEEEPVALQFVDDALSVREETQQLSVCVETLNRIITPVAGQLFSESGSSTADEGSDFIIADRTVVFESGTMPGDRECFSLTILSDSETEGDETIGLALLIDGQPVDRLTVTITEEEEITPPVVGFRSNSYSVLEGDSVLACVEIISGSTRDPFSLQMLSILALSASADDITQFQTIVTFGSGSTEGDIECVEIFATSDNLMEGNEILFLVLFPLPTETTPFTIDSGRMIALLTILNRDVQGPVASVTFINSEITVSEDVEVEVSCLIFTTATSAPLGQDVVVIVESADETAVSFSIGDDPPDYLPVNNNVTIASGTPSGTTFCVSFSIIDDELLENTETFTLYLNSLSPDLLSVSERGKLQTVSIRDNEPRVSEFRTEFNGLRTGETSDPFGVQLCIIQVSNGPLLETVFIDASAQNFTAREFEDFVFLPGIPYVFFAGSRAGTESCRDVLIVNDEIAELDEEFNVNLTPQTEAATVLDPTATITIEDDDLLYVQMLQPAISTSEDSGEVFVCVMVAQTSPVLEDLRLRIGTADGTAVANRDYVMEQTDLIFPPGTQAGDVQCLGIRLIDNNLPEETLYFRVVIVPFDPFVRIFRGYNTTIVNITDDDRSQVAFQQNEYPVTEGAGIVTVCVALLGDPLTFSVFVRVTTQDGTARAGSDYLAVNATLIISALVEDFVTCIPIAILNDAIAEAEQSFTVLLTSEFPEIISVADGGGLAKVTITDDEATGQLRARFEMTEVAVVEDDNEPTTVCVQLLGGDLGESGAVLVIFTEDGTAEGSEDYSSFSVTLTLPANSPNGTRLCTVLTVLNDEEMEQREYFSIGIENQSPDVVTVFEGEDELMVRILDDDSPMAVVGFQVLQSTVDESIANKFTCIEIFSGGPLLFDASITFYTQDGSAKAPEDYTAVSRTLTFRAGATGQRPSDAVCVGVPIIDDIEAEELESLSFHIIAVDVDRIRVDEDRAWKHLYIEDNDVVRVGFERSEYQIFESVGRDMGLLVCVTVEDVIFPFTLTTTTMDISATEILDYRVNNSPLQFLLADGNQTQCAYVQVIDDDIPEPPESFTFTLSSNSSAVVVPYPSATIYILDDDN